MQNRETVGIPLGSVAYDFLAEILLGYIDSIFADEIKKEKIDIEILRYRDDYRIFGNDLEKLNRSLVLLQKTLARFKLSINSSKTVINKDLILEMIKPDKIETFYTQNNVRNCQKRLLQILAISKDFPNSSSVARMLTNLLTLLEKGKVPIKSSTEAKTLIAISTEIGIRNLKYFHITSAITSHLLDKVSKKKQKDEIAQQVLQKVQTLPNIGYLEIWLQRMIMNDSTHFNEPLCKLASNHIFTRIWNIDWVDNNYKTNFHAWSIFSEREYKNIKKTISSDEVSIFHSY